MKGNRQLYVTTFSWIAKRGEIYFNFHFTFSCLYVPNWGKRTVDLHPSCFAFLTLNSNIVVAATWQRWRLALMLICQIWYMCRIEHTAFTNTWLLVCYSQDKVKRKHILLSGIEKKNTEFSLMLLVLFYTPEKHQKIFGFLMFIGGIEKHQWCKIG